MKKFKTMGGKPIENLIEYIENYILEHDNVEILVGTDSQRYSKEIVYGTVIVLYRKGKGGHVLCSKDKVKVEPALSVKLINETMKSIEVAEYLRENGIGMVSYIDIDLNPDPKYASNTMLRSAIGMVEGYGYKVRAKHNGAMATITADHLVRH